VREQFLPFSPPLVGDEEVAGVVDSIRSGWLTTGPRVATFQSRFAEYIGARDALALNSCTAALHVALKVLGIGPGDAVVSTPMTFTSSIHVIEHVGARPILVDVEPDTLNIDPSAIEKAIADANGAVKAILPVHLYGHPCDMRPILATAKRIGAAVVDDAAHSFPASYDGRLIGAAEPADSGVRRLTAFSFYATKNLTTGEGGMLTGDPDLIDQSRIWSLHGMSRDAYKRYTAEGSWFYEVVAPGFKYNMPDLQAAIGIAQMDRLDAMQARRKAIYDRYDAALGALEEVETPTIRPNVDAARHIYPLRLNLERLQVDRARFIQLLGEMNIGSSVHFIPVHLHPYYRDRYGFQPEDFPVAYREYQRLVSLPLNPTMTDADVDDVVEAVTAIAAGNRR
jgi:dTDP-4-amino-4,6-dideoxygalactose transaminase